MTVHPNPNHPNPRLYAHPKPVYGRAPVDDTLPNTPFERERQARKRRAGLIVLAYLREHVGEAVLIEDLRSLLHRTTRDPNVTLSPALHYIEHVRGIHLRPVEFVKPKVMLP